MRLSTVIISSAFVLAGMSAAFSTERENMLVARADSDFLAEVEARAYDEELELYARGGIISKPSRGRSRPWGSRPQTEGTSMRDPLLTSRPVPNYHRDTTAYRPDKERQSARQTRFGNNRGVARYDLD
ncbi:hypothetical protein JOM56_013970 [Amanita muscaria]